MWVFLGVSIPENKQIVYALLIFFGMGLTRSIKLCRKCGICVWKKVHELTKEEKALLVYYLKKNFILEKTLQDNIKKNVERYIRIKSRRGMRHKDRLPVRGQRTHSNAQTIKRQDKGLFLKHATKEKTVQLTKKTPKNIKLTKKTVKKNKK